MVCNSSKQYNYLFLLPYNVYYTKWFFLNWIGKMKFLEWLVNLVQVIFSNQATILFPSAHIHWRFIQSSSWSLKFRIRYLVHVLEASSKFHFQETYTTDMDTLETSHDMLYNNDKILMHGPRWQRKKVIYVQRKFFFGYHPKLYMSSIAALLNIFHFYRF